MYWHNIIFSDEKHFRIQRHSLFWIARFAFLIITIRINRFAMGNETISWDVFLLTCQMSAVKVIMEMVYCYTALYWLLPKYFVKAKYFRFGFALLSISILHNVFFLLFLNWFIPGAIQEISQFFQSVITNFVLAGPFAICLLLIAYKMLKTWHQKEEEKTLLIIENTKAELLLLKAQIHPHFLFNTLNNIYSYALDASARAGELVAKLSHTLAYITQASDQSQVLVENELKMLQDYMELEKVRYSNRLTMHVDITGDHRMKLMPPLLLIPFMENSFKHGASKMVRDSWIRLEVNIEDDTLSFKLSNSKPANSHATHARNGLGLPNVRRRLELLFPNAHYLDITSRDYQFSVHLVINLTKIPTLLESVDSHSITPAASNPVSYA